MTGEPYPYPYPPAGAPWPPVVRRPASVTAAFWIYLVSIAVSGVSTWILLTSRQWQDFLTAFRSQYSQAALDRVLPAIVSAGVIGGLIGLGIGLLFVFKMRAGRNWARVVLTVFGGLGLVFSLTGGALGRPKTTLPVPTPNPLIVGVSTVLTITVLVLMYLPASNAYFSTMKAVRQYHLLQNRQSAPPRPFDVPPQ